jgi:membrane dipeptidase
LKNHPRNKTDEQIRYIVDNGGFVGVTMFPAFLNRGGASTVEDYVDAIEYVINLAGEEQVGIGTDFTQEQPAEFFDWITRDKGYGRRLVDFGEILELDGLRRISDLPNLTACMDRRGWSERRMGRVLGENWLRLLRDVWGS